MKHLYSTILGCLLLAAPAVPSVAAEWSYDWPITATSDKNSGYANGFYNFSSSFDEELTTMTRTFNGKQWTITVDPDTHLAYTGSGQSIGSSTRGTAFFELSSDSFDGVIKSATIQIKTKSDDATVQFTVGNDAYLCNGNLSASVNSDNALHDYVFTPAGNGAEGKLTFRFDAPSANQANYVKKITIVYEERVAGLSAPAFSPEPGVYDGPVEVTLSAAGDASIWYTLDGSSPLSEENPAATLYSAPFTLAETTLVKCAAKSADDASAVAEGKYNIRKEAGLSLLKDAFTIELLEEDIILLNNPNNVEPVTFSSSNPQVAACSKYGQIYTFSLGETLISVKFAGNDDFLPQTLTVPVTVVAKDPVVGFSVSPEGGEYDGPLTVTMKCTDPRVETIWYNVADKRSELDDLGILEYGQYTIHPATELTLTLDHDCVLSAQAMGTNLWSDPIFCDYKINMPLKADFKALADNYEVIYHQGFDSPDEANEWDYSRDSEWQLVSGSPIPTIPSFSVIDPSSKASLYHAYDYYDSVSIAASPVITIPENASLRFYMVFNPVWLYYGNVEIYAAEDSEDAISELIWDAMTVADEAATDDMNWNQYYVDLARFAGRDIYFAIAYGTSGDDVMIDNFEVVVAAPESDVISITAGDSVDFRDLSTGSPDSWSWSLPGASPAVSSEQNPAVVYNTPGEYDATLTVTRGPESDTLVRHAYIKVAGAAPTALIGMPESVYFSPEASIVVPLDHQLTFTDKSKGGPSSWLWSLPGTDLKSAVTPDVTVKYETEGLYDIDLSVSNDYGTSSTYICGVKAGGENPVWNIPTADNGDLGIINLGWYGAYGGTNWLDLLAFAERFDAPAVAAEISGANIYFAAAEADDPNAEITVSLMLPDANGLPSATLASASLTVAELVDASETYNDPTRFEFETPVKVDSPFFIAVSGFPNEGMYDNVVIYALLRADGHNTAYHLMAEYDEDYALTGENAWYSQEDDAVSLAIAPVLKFADSTVGVANVAAQAADEEIFNLQGIRLSNRNLDKGIYLVRKNGKTEKVSR